MTYFVNEVELAGDHGQQPSFFQLKHYFVNLFCGVHCVVHVYNLVYSVDNCNNYFVYSMRLFVQIMLMVPSPSQQKTFDLFLRAEVIAALSPPSERLIENIRVLVAVGTMYFLPFIVILYTKFVIDARKRCNYFSILFDSCRPWSTFQWLVLRAICLCKCQMACVQLIRTSTP